MALAIMPSVVSMPPKSRTATSEARASSPTASRSSATAARAPAVTGSPAASAGRAAASPAHLGPRRPRPVGHRLAGGYAGRRVDDRLVPAEHRVDADPIE